MRLFAAAREAAGTGRDTIDARTLGEAQAILRDRYGPEFAVVLDRARIWVNGEPADDATPLEDADEVAVLPPVSGGQ